MKLISILDKKFTVSVILGILLTINCIPMAISLYLTFKKDDKTEDDDDDDKTTKLYEARFSYDPLKEMNEFESYGILPILESSLNTTINNTSGILPMAETLLPHLCHTGDIILGFVLAMKTPNEFWIHVLGRSTTRSLGNLMVQMTEYYGKEQNIKLHTLKTIIPGQMVAAKFKNFKNKFKFLADIPWHRAKVIKVVENSQCEVFYVDYGEVDIISMDDILELHTDMLNLRHQAVKCSLANIKPRGNEWSSDACNQFANFAYVGQFKSVFFEVKGYRRDISHEISPSSYIPYVNIYRYIQCENLGRLLHIGKLLKSLGLAEFKKEVYWAENSLRILFRELSQDQQNLQSASSSLLAENS